MPDEAFERRRAQLDAQPTEPVVGGVYRVWGDTTSPYTTKLWGVLHYRRIPYRQLRVTTEVWFEVLPKLVGMPILPVVLSPDGRVLQDSTPIVAWLEEAHRGPEHPSVVPDDPALAFVDSLLEDVADEYLPRLSMHTRWGTEENKGTLARRLARQLTWGVDANLDAVTAFLATRQSGFDHHLGLTAERRAGLDEQVRTVLDQLNAHLPRYGYLLGRRPSRADFAFYGQIRAHWWADPGSAPVVESRGPEVIRWMQDIDELGDTRGMRDEQVRARMGDFADLDDLWPTLAPLLKFASQTWLPMGRDSGPASVQRQKRFQTTVWGEPLEVSTHHYRVWAFEQIQRAWLRLPDELQSALEGRLQEIGILPGLIDGGIHANGLYDGLTPPVIQDGIADARIRHRRQKETS
ncbi:MAG: glutathione S-transferase [Myxococcota bacterium]